MKANRILLGAACLAVMSLGLWLPSLTLAAPAATLPPRATLTPSPAAGTPDPRQGGMIILYVPTTRTDLWAVVQWKDGLGKWHEVETWRNQMDALSRFERWQVWAVYPEHFGRGPFRWMVYSHPSGQLYDYSETFYLPKGPQDRVAVRVVEPTPTPTAKYPPTATPTPRP